mmetsp:Transcript_67420/g.166546  ORF Transcript_67420/g.166546 Transcript_67420/m.166546 type:complete len:116 (-) Transcript_67420:346-693(-)
MFISRITAVSILKEATALAESASTATSIATAFDFITQNEFFLTAESARLLVNDIVKRAYSTLGCRSELQFFYNRALANADFAKANFIHEIRTYARRLRSTSTRLTPSHPTTSPSA